jgi:hypothetical protein
VSAPEVAAEPRYMLDARTPGRRRRRAVEETGMATFFYNLVPFAVAAVAVVLLFGLYNMLRGGSPDLSQKLMRWRVILQLVAIIVIMATVYFTSR